ncbi:MAG TPA: chemotaxis protein CheW, partial [Spirochaeta sp.]|nr:chemotaxis protein CheW [Spirochaeta sp.]
DVVTLEDGQIEPPPKMGIFKDNNYLSGMGKVDDRFIIILDIDRILSDEELDVIKHTEE